MEGGRSVSNDSQLVQDHGQNCAAADKLLCNICDSESLRDPLVTSCGHLYCGPCLYERLQNQSETTKQCLACASPLLQSFNFVRIYVTDSEPVDEQPGLQCRICLESPTPTNTVATSCGHVYCWPCLYQWLRTHYRERGPCPVCRTLLQRNVNILPIFGNRELHAGNDVTSNAGTELAEPAANSGGLIIPPRPSPPEDALSLISPNYDSSDDEYESDAEFDFQAQITAVMDDGLRISDAEFDFQAQNTAATDDGLRINDDEFAEIRESLVRAIRRELGERTFLPLERVLRNFVSSELLRMLRNLPM